MCDQAYPHKHEVTFSLVLINSEDQGVYVVWGGGLEGGGRGLGWGEELISVGCLLLKVLVCKLGSWTVNVLFTKG